MYTQSTDSPQYPTSGRNLTALMVLCLMATAWFLVLSCTQPSDPEEVAYIKEVEAKRLMKDKQFKSAGNSPIPREKIRNFSHLQYFPVDAAYRVEATFLANDADTTFTIETSTGEKRTYVKKGSLQFALHGKRYTLAAYQDRALAGKKEYAKHLFVPFTDATTGKESYGAGRYLDVNSPDGQTVTLDFNLAYNPYCAYNHNYSCPLPPRENHLPVRIEAGEKLLY
jgi:uncharacterized protein (DUF1684 family)